MSLLTPAAGLPVPPTDRVAAGGGVVVVTGYDDRNGCGFVLSTGADAGAATPGTETVAHGGTAVRCTPELAATLRDALAHRPVTRRDRFGPEVPLTLDDATVLAWLVHDVGGVLTVSGGPARPRA